MRYELQYHKDVLIEVRHVGEDGIPRDVHSRPKPWGTGETCTDGFRLEKLDLTVEEGEKRRASSKAYSTEIMSNFDYEQDIFERAMKLEPATRDRLKGLL